MYKVTRTYNGNTDVMKRFNDLTKASECYFTMKTIVGDTARIELEEDGKVIEALEDFDCYVRNILDSDELTAEEMVKLIKRAL